MITKEEIIRKIENNKKAIKSFGVKKLILFGSYAAGRAKEESDIDFLVEFEKGRGLYDDYIHLQHFLESLFKKKIEIVKPALIREELKESILRGAQIEAQI